MITAMNPSFLVFIVVSIFSSFTESSRILNFLRGGRQRQADRICPEIFVDIIPKQLPNNDVTPASTKPNSPANSDRLDSVTVSTFGDSNVSLNDEMSLNPLNTARNKKSPKSGGKNNLRQVIPTLDLERVREYMGLDQDIAPVVKQV